MKMLLPAFICLASVLVTKVLALESDSYGRYFYDRYGNREYTSCFSYSARTVDACRTSTYNSDNYDRSYDDRYRTVDRSSNSLGRIPVQQSAGDRADLTQMRYNDEQDGLYLGKGEFAVYGRDVELTCEFPYSTNIISTILWQKLQEDYGYSTVRRWNEVNSYDRRMQVTPNGDNKSKLLIRNWDQRDEGVYRCVGTRAGSSYRYKESVYMEVDFKPDNSGSSSYRQYNSFDDVFEGRVQPSRPNYSSYFPNK